MLLQCVMFGKHRHHAANHLETTEGGIRLRREVLISTRGVNMTGYHQVIFTHNLRHLYMMHMYRLYMMHMYRFAIRLLIAQVIITWDDTCGNLQDSLKQFPESNPPDLNKSHGMISINRAKCVLANQELRHMLKLWLPLMACILGCASVRKDTYNLGLVCSSGLIYFSSAVPRSTKTGTEFILNWESEIPHSQLLTFSNLENAHISFLTLSHWMSYMRYV